MSCSPVLFPVKSSSRMEQARRASKTGKQPAMAVQRQLQRQQKACRQQRCASRHSLVLLPRRLFNRGIAHLRCGPPFNCRGLCMYRHSMSYALCMLQATSEESRSGIITFQGGSGAVAFTSKSSRYGATTLSDSDS